jgi:hypothetical protein
VSVSIADATTYDLWAADPSGAVTTKRAMIDRRRNMAKSRLRSGQRHPRPARVGPVPMATLSGT